MNLPHRLWRLARRQVLDRLKPDWEGPRRSASASAYDELDAFLNDPTAGAQARAGSRPATASDSQSPRGRTASQRPSAGHTPEAPPAGTASQTGSPPPPHPLEREYRLLGAPVGSDLATVRHHWRRLVRETHPDRFAHDPIAQQQAADRLRAINEAYFRLRNVLSQPG